MYKMKILCLLLVVMLATVSLLVIQPTDAQSIPKPSVPEATLEFVHNPYEIAPKTSIDPYTGDNVTIEPGNVVENRSIVLTIKNQPFTPYKDSKGNTINLFYNISVKGSFESNWRYFPHLLSKLPLISSNNDNTILLFNFITSYMEPQIEKPNDPYFFKLGTIPVGSQVDFQVQALIGYYTYPLYETDFLNNFFNGESSEWSSTQTITIGKNPATTTPDLYFPSQSLSPIVTVALLGVIAVVIVFTVVFLHKRSVKQVKYQGAGETPTAIFE